MPATKDILNELSQLSPTVAAISGANVFSVPDNYFEAFPAVLVNLVKDDTVPAFTNIGRQPGSVPAGYFNTLADTILNRIHEEENIRDNETVSSLLDSIGNRNIFSVPAGYFETLVINVHTPMTVSEEIQELSPVLATAGNANIFTVPDEYFETLNIAALNIDKSVANELLQLSPTLAAMGNKNIFTTPVGYFAGLKMHIVKDAAPAKIVNMKKPGIFRYMAAAVVAGIIGLTLVSLPAADNNNVVTPQTASAEPVMAQEKKIITDKTFDDELNNLSEKEIVAYLKDNGQDINSALVASATDETDLPNADEYILDGNTLDNFLNDMNLKN